LPERL